jgi:hypothetical protein
MSPVNYRLELPTQWSIHNVFHTDLLTPYRETPTHGANYQRPPPDLVDGVEEYEVEKVLDSRQYGRGCKLQYLIAWKGYPGSDNQWVSWDDAEGAEEVIREFKCLNPDHKTHIKVSNDSPCSSLSYSRISSMSTSPSTAHWDVVTRPSSYFAPAITYGNNNNINDAITYNNYRHDRSSPGLDSNDLKNTTTLRDVENAMSSFLDPEPARISEDSTGRPPVLEDGSGLVGARLHIQSVDETREETGIAGKSAGNTPHPNIAILLDSGDDKDDDIQCGRCKNPIAYCHCSPTMLPPRINVNEEKDNEETPVSPTETANNESRPMEVRVGRGMEGETNHGGRVQAHRHWMYAPGTPQRLTHRSLSPTPDGFVRNQGLNYVPFRIPTTNSRGVVPAKYVMVYMGINPTVAGCMYKGGVVYQGDVHAAPSHDHGDRVPDYTHEQLRHFRSDYT